ncbi:hypothetical protein [Winogradskyella vidalii]|uniref:hypothetical protein n=1 Tax=Winogradskyella vidalii TaxID=2615024 RepID=UPI0015CEAD66|nr:hypothetical protein [Winogradskyella vidalii]
MSNLLKRLNPKMRLILGVLGAFLALSLYYLMDTFNSGGLVSFLFGFSLAFSFGMLVSYKWSTFFKHS